MAALTVATVPGEKVVACGPRETRRSEYRPPEYFIKHADLRFELDFNLTQVHSVLHVYRGPGILPGTDLELHGHSSISLVSVALRTKKDSAPVTLDSSQYYIREPFDNLVISGRLLPEPAEEIFEVHAAVTINPGANTELQGLFKTGPMLCTQCEAEGFRMITYFLDRPDVMASFQVEARARKADFPILLSNGDRIAEGSVIGGDRHFVVFHDPHPKPAYLFALVAGDLKAEESTFMRKTGKPVRLALWCEPKDAKKLGWAMESLKQAMKWDEERFGLVYDLDYFNLVAVSYFNMGAMENKSLNIFNSALLLASKDTTTDVRFEQIRGVVGHEYFHNWTGNRVTCRDWFQLTLKEGLTVYRDQEFSADMGCRAVARIEDVSALKSVQFPEDDGPMCHPVRPESYQQIDNFYTATVYQKGAEVIRMYATILGREGFRKGMDLYIQRHDGQAVTCEDFRKAMADASGRNLDQFERWYSQAGTPVVRVMAVSHAQSTFTITFEQLHLTDPEYQPLHIPIAFGLIGKDSKKEVLPTTILNLTERVQEFQFTGIPEPCVASILRGFSAPVKLLSASSDGKEDDDLGFLMAYDTDEVNRWEAGQRLMIKAVRLKARASGSPPSEVAMPEEVGTVTSLVLRAFEETLRTCLLASCQRSFAALLLTLPSIAAVMAVETSCYDPVALGNARRQIQKEIGAALREQFECVYKETTASLAAREYDLSEESVGLRHLRNVALTYLTSSGDTSRAFDQYTKADNMNDRFAGAHWDKALADFLERGRGEELVVQKWFEVQASADHESTLETVKGLKRHQLFDKTNPNCIRALLTRFAMNAVHFHRPDGEGYRFIGRCIAEIDGINGRMAARLASELVRRKRLDSNRQRLMETELIKLLDLPPSPHLHEILAKSLEGKS